MATASNSSPKVPLSIIIFAQLPQIFVGVNTGVMAIAPVQGDCIITDITPAAQLDLFLIRTNHF